MLTQRLTKPTGAELKEFAATLIQPRLLLPDKRCDCEPVTCCHTRGCADVKLNNDEQTKSRLPEVRVLRKSTLEVLVPRAQLHERNEFISASTSQRYLCPIRRKGRQVVVTTVQHLGAEFVVSIYGCGADPGCWSQLLQRCQRLHRDADLHQVRGFVVRHQPKWVDQVRRNLLCVHTNQTDSNAFHQSAKLSDMLTMPYIDQRYVIKIARHTVFVYH